jgi:hypothetical protein
MISRPKQIVHLLGKIEKQRHEVQGLVSFPMRIQAVWRLGQEDARADLFETLQNEIEQNVISQI